eukprot:2730538-Rhodomonas_salina.1
MYTLVTSGVCHSHAIPSAPHTLSVRHSHVTTSATHGPHERAVDAHQLLRRDLHVTACPPAKSTKVNQSQPKSTRKVAAESLQAGIKLRKVRGKS